MRGLLLLLVALALPGETIVCLGDSLTAGLGLREDEAWPARLQAALLAAGKDTRVVNAGISGDTTSSAMQRIHFVLRTKPDIVIIALGANDGLRGQEVAAIETNLRKLINEVRAVQAKPILAGMQMPTNYGEEYRTAFAAIYPQIAKDLDIPLIPFLLDGVGGIAEHNQADGVHPNATGHERIAKTVQDHLAQASSR